MVKPCINLDGGLKKESMKDQEAKGTECSLPAFAVIPLGTDLPPKIDEHLAVATIPVINRPRKLGVCLCVSMLLVLLLIIGLAVAMFLGHGKMQYKFHCGVGYGDGDRDFHGGDDQIPDGTLDEDVEVDPFEGYEQIEVPEQDYCERLTILHDFNVNMTAYRLRRSMVCYVTWLDKEIVLGPSEFIKKAEENPQFLSDHYETVHETYRVVLPELTSLDYGFGYYIPMLCDSVDTYWIEKIPEGELKAWEEHWADQYPEETDEDDDDDDDEDDDALPAPKPDHRRRRAAGSNGNGFDNILSFSGKLVKAKIYQPGLAKAALDQIAA